MCDGDFVAQAVHVRHPFPVSAHVHRRLEKLRHLASVRLTCIRHVRYDASGKQSGGGPASISQTSGQRRPDEDAEKKKKLLS